MQIAFGRVRRKTSPAAVKYQTLLCSDVFGLYYNTLRNHVIDDLSAPLEPDTR